jgi:hypothetical protein
MSGMDGPKTTLGIGRNTLTDLKQLALDAERAEGRTVTVAEMIARLVAAARRQATPGARHG